MLYMFIVSVNFNFSPSIVLTVKCADTLVLHSSWHHTFRIQHIPRFL